MRPDKRILLVRHPEMEGAESGRYFGRTDVPLTSRGLRQAEALARALASERVGLVYSSPLRRAQAAALLVARRHKAEVRLASGLREIDFGEWEGWTLEEMRRADAGLFEAWLRLAPGFAFPGGESLEGFRRRVLEEYWRILEAISSADDSSCVIIAHGGVNKVILADILGLPLGRMHTLRQSLGGINIIEYYAETAVISCLNDTCYLLNPGKAF